MDGTRDDAIFEEDGDDLELDNGYINFDTPMKESNFKKSLENSDNDLDIRK